VLLSVPIAVVGAFLGLYMRGMALDVFGQIGLVMLIGLAAKNAILIVEFAKAGFERGDDLVAAALEGARLALAPDSDDLVRIHSRLRPPLDRQRRRSGGTSDPGDGGHLGDVGGDRNRHLLLPVLFVVVERLGGAGRRGKQEAAPKP